MNGTNASNRGRGRGRNRVRRNAGNRNRQPAKHVPVNELVSSRVPRNLRPAVPMPTKLKNRMRFIAANVILQDAVNPFAVLNIVANDIYNPLSAYAAAGTINGFPALSAIYSLWRVNKISWSYKVVCNEPARSLDFGMRVSDTLPAPTTYLQARNLLGVEPSTPINTVGETQGSSKFESPRKPYSIRIGTVLGNPVTYESSTTYAGRGAPAPASPANLLYLTFVLLSDNVGVSLTNGAFITIDVTYHVEWFSIANNF